MKNNRTGLIVGIVAIIIVVGAAFWLSHRPAADTALPAPVAVGTSTLPALASTTAPTAPAVTATNPTITESVWKDFSNDLWRITLKWGATWKASAIPTEDGELSQLSIGGKHALYFVSRNIPIAEPSGGHFTTGSRTVAGETVTVHDYQNPNATYVSYEYFSIPVGRDTYYFQIKEMTGAAKEVQDFLGFIAIK